MARTHLSHTKATGQEAGSTERRASESLVAEYVTVILNQTTKLLVQSRTSAPRISGANWNFSLRLINLHDVVDGSLGISLPAADAI